MIQTCLVVACFPWLLPGAEPLRPKCGLWSSEGFWERSLLHCVFCMKVFGEEAETRLGAHVLLPLLGVCRGLPGTPGAWLQLWQTVTFHVS